MHLSMNLLSSVFVFATFSNIVIGNQSQRKIADYLGTEQFLFVGLSNCHLTTEGSPPPGNCPYHVTYQTSTFETTPLCARARLHLLFSERRQPQALILASSTDGFTIAKLNRLNWPDIGASQFAFRSEPLDLNDPSDVGGKIEYHKVTFTLFDGNYRLLYVFHNSTIRSRRAVNCLIFYVNLYSDKRVGFSYIGKIDVHPENDLRTMWSEDPYEHKFYYIAKERDNIGLYSVPYNKLVLTIMTGMSGTLETLLPDQLAYVSVSRGVVLSYKNSSKHIAHFTQNLKDKTSKGIVCERVSERSRLSSFIALKLLFDKHYCALRDDSTSPSNCSDVGETTLVPKELFSPNKCSNNEAVYWLLGIIIALSCFVLVLAVQVWRSRQKMVDETFLKAERPQIHHYPTFISEPSCDF